MYLVLCNRVILIELHEKTLSVKDKHFWNSILLKYLYYIKHVPNFNVLQREKFLKFILTE